MLKAKKPSNNNPEKAKAMAALSQNDEPIKRLVADIPLSYTRKLSNMRTNSVNTTTFKTFVVEALDDLFEKYERGDGNQPMS